MLESHTRQKDTIDTIAIKRAKKNNVKKNNQEETNRVGRLAMKLLGGGGGGEGRREGASTSFRSTNAPLTSALGPQKLSCSVCVEDS